MHPYRAALYCEPEPSRDRDAAALEAAVGVLAAVSAVEVATALVHGGPFAPQTLFGAGLLVVALAHLARHAGSGVGSRRR